MEPLEQALRAAEVAGAKKSHEKLLEGEKLLKAERARQNLKEAMSQKHYGMYQLEQLDSAIHNAKKAKVSTSYVEKAKRLYIWHRAKLVKSSALRRRPKQKTVRGRGSGAKATHSSASTATTTKERDPAYTIKVSNKGSPDFRHSGESTRFYEFMRLVSQGEHPTTAGSNVAQNSTFKKFKGRPNTWEFYVSGAGRVIFELDNAKRVCTIIYASSNHPK